MKNWRVTHGMSATREYRIWRSILSRCYSKKWKKFHLYGGRGITVCDEWKDSFENFYRDMGNCPTEHHSIDRKDGNGPYCKANCKWSTVDEQNNNKRTNISITYDGKTLTMAQWANELGLRRDCLSRRIKKGLPVGDVLSVKKTNPKPRLITYNGETKNITDWARSIGIKRETLNRRLNAGWKIERALSL